MNDHLKHDAPLEHLVKQILHKGRTTAELVRGLRYRRRKSAKTTVPEVEVGGVLLEKAEVHFDESDEANPPMTVEEVVAMPGMSVEEFKAAEEEVNVDLARMKEVPEPANAAQFDAERTNYEL